MQRPAHNLTKRELILQMLAGGDNCSQVAGRLGVSKQWVSRVNNEENRRRPVVCPCCKERVLVRTEKPCSRNKGKGKNPLLVIADMIEEIGCHKCLDSGLARARGLG